MAKLSFKVYMINDDLSDHVEQVRRFAIDTDVAMNYNYLRERLQTFFPELRSRNFIMAWRDDEKENITISTNEELEIALTEMSKDIRKICKLYIILQNEKETSAEAKKTEKTCHPGVICDMCDKKIYGFRFKCMQCVDYDLCFDCMTLGYHPEHYMVRMTNPVDWSSYHGHRLNHHMRKFVRRMMYSSKDDERKAKGGRRGGSGTRGCPMFNTTGDACDEQKRSPKEQQQQQHRDPSTEAATEATENPQQEVTKDKFSQLMKMLEDNFSSISQFLDPLGISVSVVDDRDANKQSKPAKNAAQEKAAEGQTADETGRESKKFPGKGKKLCDDSTEEKAGPSDNATSVQKDTAAASCSAEQAAEADEWTMLQCDSAMNISRASSASSSSSNGAIPKQAASSTSTAPSPPAEAAKAEPPKPMYPPLPQEVKHEFYHPNPKIQNAVETMMAMGFSNDGGWLTHLLVSKNGDICQALDVLSAVQRK
ncbi:sequestosome-1 isoform X2 [Ooceraea biroi]|uniref:sequestosome-1 isoform X2 n=1 Tax=Ooceraea biroi TaxID=2015173 RepID=UPI0005BD0C4A|nr:sequestosome-1 isoform X2 [Ooceraea biroi]